jgi:acyl-CoA thioesterase-2
MTSHFLDLRSTHNSHRWYLPVTPDVTVGPLDKAFLFGGAGMSAAVRAMEQTCNKPVIWATAHYLSYARTGSIVDFDVREVVVGKTISQVRVVAHIGDREILTVNAAVGQREGPSDQWRKAPDVPAPEDCPPVKHWRGGKGTTSIHSRFETRLAAGRYPTQQIEGGRSEDGRLVTWVRSSEGLQTTSDLLAVIADFVPQATSHALGIHAGGNSLDNTVRFARIMPTDWILCDIRIETIENGITHGSIHLFSRTGELMATCSQSLILRVHAPPPMED